MQNARQKQTKLVQEPPQIIVVEDDASVSKAIVRLLDVAGFKAKAFGSAEAFLESHESHEFHCLILDVNLPGLSGLELYDQLAATRIFPVIFVTAHDEPGARSRMHHNGNVIYVSKPFHARTLIGALRKLLTAAQPVQQ